MDMPALTLREDFRRTIAEIRACPNQTGQMAVDVDGNIKGILHLAGCPDIASDGCGNRI
jgi:hypothetical protein